METQKKLTENCCSGGAIFKNKRKKIIVLMIIFLALLFVLFAGVVAAKVKLHEKDVSLVNQSSNAGVAMYPSPYSPYDGSQQFILPRDVSKSGEILMQVASADDVAKNISAVASSNVGTVYATYSSALQKNGAKSGYIVVQVDENKFDATYASLKSLGARILQESTKKIPSYDYPVPISAGVVPVPTVEPNSGATATQPTIAPVPVSIYPANKGYIKVNFIEVSATVAGLEKNREMIPAWISYEGMGLRKNILVVLAIKSIAVIALIFIIIILTIRLVRHARQRKANKKKPVVHIVRQQIKTRSRVVRIAKRK